MRKILMLSAAACTLLLPQAGMSQATMRHSAATVLAASPAPDLDLSIKHYSRVLTAEGVTRESRYEETMMRRNKHVWVARVLPSQRDQHVAPHVADGRVRPVSNAALPDADSHLQRHFNPATVPRHVTLDSGKLKLEFIDSEQKEVVAIAPTEYDNVNFDGSWVNAYYLLDPAMVSTLFLARQSSPVAGAHWRSREKDGYFQRVLWDDKRMIPLVIETGNRSGSFFRRTQIQPRASLRKDLPWENTKGYAKKEYVDFPD